MTGTKTHTKFQMAASIFMILALVWLTVSVPFVYAGQQKLAAEKKISKQVHHQDEDSGDQSCNPFGNNTEEKAPSSGINSLSEEFLHLSDDLFHAVELFLSHHSVHSVDEYISFHGEMLCPPPNRLS
ncbi:MAG: hypothetical protein ABWZ25_07995 [Chitinophagaceae bacterium]